MASKELIAEGLGYQVGLGGGDIDCSPFDERSKDHRDWISGFKRGRDVSHNPDLGDTPVDPTIAEAALTAAKAKGAAKEYLALSIEADGFEIARAVELWLLDYMTPGKMSDGPVPYGILPHMLENCVEGPEAFGLRFARGLIEYLKKG